MHQLMNKLINITFLGFLLFLFSCTDTETPEQAERELPNAGIAVKTARIIQQLERSSIESLGIVTSQTESKPSFKTGGVIDQTFFREGAYVKAGAVMATLHMTEIDAQVEQARVGFEKANRDLSRVQNLHADSVATLEQVENTKTAIAISKQNVEIAEFNKKYSEVKAPISGRIVRQLLHEGEIAGPGMPVYVIIGTAKKDWRIKTGLIDREWAQVEIGDEAKVALDAYPNQFFEAVVTDKALIAADASGTIEIELSFKEQPPALAAGMICKVRLQSEKEEEQTVIPIGALVNTNGLQATVFVLDRGVAKKKTIQIDRLLGDKVAVASGLEEVEEVVTIGSTFLQEGDSVSIIAQ